MKNIFLILLSFVCLSAKIPDIHSCAQIGIFKSIYIGSVSVTGSSIGNYNTAYSWGNHAGLYPLLSGSYTNPSWIVSIPFSKITNQPTTISGYGITDATSNARSAISLTTTGSGAATYNNSTGALNVPVSSSGTVTSIGLSSSDLSVSGSPVTSSGSITVNLATSGVTAGTYGAVTVDTKGRVTSGKRVESYSGTTNSSGLYTITYGASYSVTPNVQFQINGGSNKQSILLTSSTTTGFTCYVQLRSDVVGLLPSYSNVNGQAVDVLVTEK